MNKYFNKFMVSAAGNGNLMVMNQIPIYSREDAINLCVWLKIVALITDEELNEYEAQAANPQPHEGAGIQTKNLNPIPMQVKDVSPTLTAPNTPAGEQRIVTPTDKGTIGVPVIPPRNPTPTNEAKPGKARCSNGHQYEVSWTVANRIRQATPNRCPCGAAWTEIGP